jgi:ABC-type polysaccharide/polyol phosphate export permease
LKAQIAGRFSRDFDSSSREPLAVEELRGIFQYRELVWQLIRRDVITRYKRSILGVVWTMLNPLGTMLILTIVFSQIFHSVDGYPVFVLSGLIAWNFFSQTTTAALNQNVWGGSLLHKIYLPRTAFTVSAIGTGLVNLFISLIPLGLIMIITHHSFHAAMLFLPVSILILAAFALGVGLLFSTLALYFPDVVEMFHIGLTAWMYLTPIIYPVDIIPEKFKIFVMQVNPMYYLVELFRLPVYEGVLPSLSILVISFGFAIGFLLLGWLVFTWKANEFTYRT